MAISQEALANIALALSTLAKAPVAGFPDSGPFLLAEQAQNIARAKLAEEARRKAQKKAKKKARTGALVKGLGVAAGALTGGLAFPAISALGGAALGSTIGGGVGDVAAGLATGQPMNISALDISSALGTAQKSIRRNDRLEKRRRRRSLL